MLNGQLEKPEKQSTEFDKTSIGLESWTLPIREQGSTDQSRPGIQNTSILPHHQSDLNRAGVMDPALCHPPFLHLLRTLFKTSAQ